MRPKSIGILSGAGPLAGVQLLERVFRKATKVYGCKKDADFPEVFLLSFPFTEMLSADVNETQVRIELKSGLQQLRQNGAEVLAIACNTLHAFLDESDEQSDLIHLPKKIVDALPKEAIPLVFCTSTSRRFNLHKQFFECSYPDLRTQKQLDGLIEEILAGKEEDQVVLRLKEMVEAQKESVLLLGCTELSLFADRLSSTKKIIIDPLSVVADQLLTISLSIRN